MATPLKSPHQNSDPVYMVKCLSPIPSRYPEKCMSAQTYRRSAPRRTNGLMRRRINRSLSFEILHNRTDHQSPRFNKSTNDSVRLSRSAKILKALNIEYSAKSSTKTAREKLNFDATPSPKHGSPVNLRVDSNESLATSVHDTSAESIDENQNKTPSRRSTSVKKSLNYDSPGDFRVLSPMLRSELKRKIDDIVLTTVMPMKSIGRLRKTQGEVIASTPRNLYDDLEHDRPEERRDKLSHKKNRSGCSIQTSPTNTNKIEMDDYVSCEIPIQRTLNFSISWENRHEDEQAETGSLFEYSSVESLDDDIIDEPTTSKKSESLNSSENELFVSAIDDKSLNDPGKASDNLEKSVNDLHKRTDIQSNDIQKTADLQNINNLEQEERPSTPENSVNYLQKVMTSSIKKSHKKIKEINKKSLLRSQFSGNLMTANQPQEVYSDRYIEKSSENSLENSSDENSGKFGDKSMRKTRNSTGRLKKLDIEEENSESFGENSGKSLKLMEKSPRKTRISVEKLRKMQITGKQENSENSEENLTDLPRKTRTSLRKLKTMQIDDRNEENDGICQENLKSSPRKTRRALDKLRKMEISEDGSENEEKLEENSKEIMEKLSKFKENSEKSRQNSRKTRRSLENQEENSFKPKKMEFEEETENILVEMDVDEENWEKSEKYMTIQLKKIEFGEKNLEESSENSCRSSENSGKSLENSGKTDENSRVRTPEHLNSSRLLLSQFDSVKKSHKKDKHRKLGFAQRSLNTNGSSGDDPDHLSEDSTKFLTPNKCKSPSGSQDEYHSIESENLHSTPISSKKSLNNALKLIPLVRVEKMADFEDEDGLQKCDSNFGNDKSDEKSENWRKTTPSGKKSGKSLSSKNPITFSTRNSTGNLSPENLVKIHEKSQNFEKFLLENLLENSEKQNEKLETSSPRISLRNGKKFENCSSESSENFSSKNSSENGEKSESPQNSQNSSSPSTPANSRKLEISSLSSIKKSHKKHKKVRSCKRLLIETNDPEKGDTQDSEDLEVDKVGENVNEAVTTPPNSLAMKNHLRLVQNTSIKRSHKKIREKKKQDRLISYSNLANKLLLDNNEEGRGTRRKCRGEDE